MLGTKYHKDPAEIYWHFKLMFMFRRSAALSLRRLLICDCFFCVCLLLLRGLLRLCCLHIARSLQALLSASHTATASTVLLVTFRSSRMWCCVVGCIMRRFVFLYGPLKMKTLRFFETSETVRPVARRHSLHARCRGLCRYRLWVGGVGTLRYVVSGKRRLPSTEFTRFTEERLCTW